MIARLLLHLPVPANPEESLGVLALQPYVLASLLATSYRVVQGSAVGGADVQRPTVVLTVTLAMVLGLVKQLAAQAGAVDAAVGALSIMTGCLLLVILAHLISRHGIGNGACLLFLMLAPDARPFLAELARRVSQAEPVGSYGLLAATCLLAVVAWVGLARAQWQPGGTSGAVTSPTFRLRPIGVGLVGAFFSSALMTYGGLVGVMLPRESTTAMLIVRLGEPGWIRDAAFVLCSFLGTYFWTAQAYAWGALPLDRARQEAGDAHGAPSEAARFDRGLAIATLPVAAAGPLLALLISYSSRELEVGVPSALTLLVAVTIALDLQRQITTHRSMAGGRGEGGSEGECTECGGGVSNEAASCPSCGTVFDEGLRCETHGDSEATGVCIVCGRASCRACMSETNGRALCVDHRGLELVEGWATAWVAGSRLEAEQARHELIERGLAAVILSNTFEPAYGTLALYDLKPATFLVAHAECGGGCMRVMVRARDLAAAAGVLGSDPSRAPQSPGIGGLSTMRTSATAGASSATAPQNAQARESRA